MNRRTKGVLRGGHSPDIGKATQFKRGNLGGGRPKKTPITEIFEELLADPQTRDAIKGQVRRTLTKHGMAGVLLLREMADRLEGKVANSVDVNLSGKVTLEQVLEARRRAGK